MASDYRFERELRTPQSEAYVILEGEYPVGRIDLHFTPSIAHGVLNVSESITQEEVQDLIEVIDEELVMSADTSCEDFVVVVYQGRELGTFSAQDLEEEEEETEGRERQSGW
ncbi:MAG: hypothetical protein HY261_03645 [Chloroflexi bacterium]|nr:hypothetical protein [Chloroflexota bacterium]